MCYSAEMKIIACVAASLDGKLSPEGAAHYVRISSEADIDHLRRLRAEAGAVLMGGATFRAWPKVHHSSNPDHTPHHIILSRSADLPPSSPLFLAEPAIPVTIATPVPVDAATQAHYPAHTDWLNFGDIPDLLGQLEDRYGFDTLLVEGGGQVIRAFLEARSLAEIHITLCPLLLGGGVDWAGGWNPGGTTGVGFTIISSRTLGDEVFLHLGCHYNPAR
ncbi:MAG: RibD family protein [Candidatus Melainabacteria bacterium]